MGAKIFLIGGVLAACLLVARALLFLNTPASDGPAKPVLYEVRANAHPGQIAADLEKLGVVSSARGFYWYGRLTGHSKKYKAGDYRFTTAMRPAEVQAIIMSGISFGFPLTIPEGYSAEQIAPLLEAILPGSGKRFLELVHDRRWIASLGFEKPPASLEGYLFPDTYLIQRHESVEEVVRNMVKKFRGIFTTDMARRAQELGLTEHQVVTLASIIEKETGAPEDRGKIASVFHNRLKKKMRLQSDPTVIYGLKGFDGNITRKHLETPTPYNTYTIPGLPPGPISNPGKSSLHAALYPDSTDFLYFVSHNDGTSEFSATYEQHQRAVAKYQLDPKAREGKSWRDLSQRNAAKR